jgi:hypothetical protein
MHAILPAIVLPIVIANAILTSCYGNTGSADLTQFANGACNSTPMEFTARAPDVLRPALALAWRDVDLASDAVNSGARVLLLCLGDGMALTSTVPIRNCRTI